MVNYQLGKIYRILCNNTGEQYVGATCQKKLCTRLAQHVSKKNDCSSKGIIERGNYEMLLIESYPCNSKDELHRRERHFIETLDNCVNNKRPIRTKEEKKEYNKEWYVENKTDILEKQKKYNDENKEQKSEYDKNRYIENKVDILKQQKAYDKEYRLKNRDIINQKQKDKYQAKKLTQEEHRSERREYWQSKKEIQNDSLNHPE